MAEMVPCVNPYACGVQNHRVGTRCKGNDIRVRSGLKPIDMSGGKSLDKPKSAASKKSGAKAQVSEASSSLSEGGFTDVKEDTPYPGYPVAEIPVNENNDEAWDDHFVAADFGPIKDKKIVSYLAYDPGMGEWDNDFETNIQVAAVYQDDDGSYRLHACQEDGSMTGRHMDASVQDLQGGQHFDEWYGPDGENPDVPDSPAAAYFLKNYS